MCYIDVIFLLQNSPGAYNSDHVLLRPQWDNTRIHEEIGLPMYKAWNEGQYLSHLKILIDIKYMEGIVVEPHRWCYG